MKKRLFFFCAVFTVLGILLGFVAKEFSLLFLAPLCIIPFALRKRKFVLAVFVLLFTFSLIHSSCAYKKVDTTLSSSFISGIVSDVREGESKAFILSDVTIITPDETTLYTKNLFVSFSGESLPLPGQTVSFHSPIYPYASSARNIGELSMHETAIADNIFLRAYSTKFALLKQETTVKSIIYSLKGVVFDKIFSLADNKDAAGILYAFLTGDRAYVSSDTFSSFKAAGASHILALSGLHTGIIVFVLSRLLDLFKASKKLKFILLFAFLLLFCAFTGFSPSILRASVMTLVMLFCSAAGTRYDLLNSLSLAATLILLVNPYRLFDVSFLLSFSAVLGLACLPSVCIKNKILKKLCSALFSCVGATVFTLPLSFYFFSEASAVSIFFNLIMVPIASLTVFLTVIFIFLPSFLLQAPLFLADLLLRIAEFATRFTPLKMLSFGAGWVALIVLVLFLLTKFVQIKRLYKAIIAVLLCLALCFAHFVKDTTSKVNVLAGTNELCAHVCGSKNIFIGLDTSKTLLNYINANMRQIDVVVLLDKDDVLQMEILRQSGISIKSIIAPEGTSIDTELKVILLKENQPLILDNLVFCYLENGLELLLDNTKILFDDYSLQADASVFYLEDFGVCVWKNKLYNTDFFGMITIKQNEITTFAGD